jgi:hypothetical protein
MAQIAIDRKKERYGNLVGPDGVPDANRADGVALLVNYSGSEKPAKGQSVNMVAAPTGDIYNFGRGQSANVYSATYRLTSAAIENSRHAAFLSKSRQYENPLGRP